MIYAYWSSDIYSLKLPIYTMVFNTLHPSPFTLHPSPFTLPPNYLILLI